MNDYLCIQRLVSDIYMLRVARGHMSGHLGKRPLMRRDRKLNAGFDQPSLLV
jgi:hypothetical protein